MLFNVRELKKNKKKSQVFPSKLIRLFSDVGRSKLHSEAVFSQFGPPETSISAAQYVLEHSTVSGNACSGVPYPRYFIGLSSATLSYFTYSVVFLHNTKYPTTRPHRQTNSPHHAPSGTKHPFHPLSPSPLIPLHIQCCFTFVRDELGCEFDGNYAPFLIRQN